MKQYYAPYRFPVFTRLFSSCLNLFSFFLCRFQWVLTVLLPVHTVSTLPCSWYLYSNTVSGRIHLIRHALIFWLCYIIIIIIYLFLVFTQEEGSFLCASGKGEFASSLATAHVDALHPSPLLVFVQCLSLYLIVSCRRVLCFPTAG